MIEVKQGECAACAGALVFTHKLGCPNDTEPEASKEEKS